MSRDNHPSASPSFACRPSLASRSRTGSGGSSTCASAITSSSMCNLVGRIRFHVRVNRSGRRSWRRKCTEGIDERSRFLRKDRDGRACSSKPGAWKVSMAIVASGAASADGARKKRERDACASERRLPLVWTSMLACGLHGTNDRGCYILLRS